MISVVNKDVMPLLEFINKGHIKNDGTLLKDIDELIENKEATILDITISFNSNQNKRRISKRELKEVFTTFYSFLSKLDITELKKNEMTFKFNNKISDFGYTIAICDSKGGYSNMGWFEYYTDKKDEWHYLSADTVTRIYGINEIQKNINIV